MDPEKQRAWAARQVYIALGQLMTSCAVLKLDACPLEGIINSKYDELLSLQGTEFETVVACAVGYRSTSDYFASMKKIRAPAAVVIEKI